MNVDNDIFGLRFGMLTILGVDDIRTNESKNRKLRGEIKRFVTYLKCACDCGKETSVEKGSITSGRTTSCGCYKSKDLSGERFGRLLVISLDEQKTLKSLNDRRSGKSVHSRKYWNCICDCGNETIVETSSLKSGNTTSCGCFHKEVASVALSDVLRKYNEYEELDDCYKGWDEKHENYFLISKEDYDEVSKIYWHKNSYNYWAASRLSNNEYSNWRLHQLVAKRMCKEYKKGVDIPDHISNHYMLADRKDDNRRCNIRVVDDSCNARNKKTPKNNTSGRIGVHFDNSVNRWKVAITNNDGKILRKSFASKDDAIKQREIWEEEFGYIHNVE